MADTNDYIREKKKSLLRRRIVRGTADAPEPLSGGMEEETQEIEEQLARRKKKKLAGAALLALCAAAGILLGWYYLNHKTYSGYTLLGQTTLEGGGMAEYSSFQGNILKYSRDGAACYSDSGEMLWNQSYEMKEPLLEISGEYAVIADRQGYSIYIFGPEGCTGQADTVMPVTKAQVADQGVVAVILEGSSSNLIKFYDRTGTELEIELKTMIDEYGYPLDIGLSPDGQQLAVAYIYMDAGTMKNKVVFYNFDVGKNQPDRVVGVFMEYESAMIGEVAFLGSEWACAFADDRIDFYSLQNALSPELAKSVSYEGQEIQSVFHSGSCAGVIAEGESADGARQMHIYNAQGEELFSTEVVMAYTHAEFSGDYILLYNDTNCQIYGMNGSTIYQGTLEGTITKCIPVSRNRILQIGGQVLSELKLK